MSIACKSKKNRRIFLINLHKSEFFCNFARKLQERLEGQRHILSEEEKIRIEGIVVRLSHSVGEYDILQWLENFEIADRSDALTVLENLQYYPTKSVYANIHSHITYLNIHHKKKVYVVPVGAVGKSGSVIAYYVKKFLKKNPRYTFLTAKELEGIEIEALDVLCLVDDFSGTGKTIKDFYKEHKDSFSRFSRKYALLLAYMPRGKYALEKLGFKLLGDEYESVFQRRSSVFGSEWKMLQIREFAFKYGNLLCHYNSKKASTLQPLGYANSQALVAFDYTAPNNTLPIIWANAYVGEGRCWHPLFPRYAIDFVDQLDNTKRDYWLRLHANDGLESPFVTVDKDGVYQVERVKMFRLLELIRKGRNERMWKQCLGVSGYELNEMMDKAKSCGFLNEELVLTSNAIQFLEEIERAQKIAIRKAEEIEKDNEVYTYVPKRFMGVS